MANEWVAPQLSENAAIVIEQGRHPVVEHSIERFIANDCELGPDRRMLLITGPNMRFFSGLMPQNASEVRLICCSPGAQ